MCDGSLLEKGSVIIGCGRKLHVPERNELRKLVLGMEEDEDEQPGRGGALTGRRETGSGLRRAPGRKAGSDF